MRARRARRNDSGKGDSAQDARIRLSMGQVRHTKIGGQTMSWMKYAGGIAVVLLAAVAAGTLMAYAAGPPEDASYVGTSKCRMCHMDQYKTYKDTKHANNFDVLQGDEQKNPDCLACHTTGYGKPGGFVSLEETPKLTSVGCESCHGPGSAHVEAAKDAPESGDWEKNINRVPQNACIVCHNPHVNQKDRVAKMRQG